LTGARTVQNGDYLPEVAESMARGVVAETYDDIRRVLGLPIVNLVYRCLAVKPDRLEAIWHSLRRNLTSRAVDHAATGLIEAARPARTLPAAGLETAGLDAEELALTQATLDAYARGNSRNLLAMHALLDGCRGRGVDAEPAEPAAAGPILPMARLDDLDPQELDRLRSISRLLVGDEEPVLVPSLLRHLAARPPLLDLLWRAVEPELVSTLAVKRAVVTAEARRLAGALPFAVPRLDRSAERGIAERFAAAMSTLLVTGEAFRAALGSRL
jgi:hypothetical protein